MKIKHKLTLFFALIAGLSFSQQIIEYGYTPSGNRTQRKLSANPFRIGNLDSTKSSHVFSGVATFEWTKKLSV